MDNKKVIMIDAGHGFNARKKTYSRPLMRLKDGKVTVASATLKEDSRDHSAGFYREDHATLLIAMAAAKELSDMGYEVHCTRSDHMNAGYNLAEELKGNKWQRAQWKSSRWIKEATKKYKADVFVSIHTNAGGGTGCSAFFADSQGKDLAKSICEEISGDFGLKIRRIAEHRYLILRDACQGNACLVECAFHDDPNDLAMLLEDGGLDKFGKAIAKGVNSHLES